MILDLESDAALRRKARLPVSIGIGRCLTAKCSSKAADEAILDPHLSSAAIRLLDRFS